MKISHFILLSISIFILASCTSNGKKYSLDKDHSVLYKGDGVDETQAKKLAEYFKTVGLFVDGVEQNAQITKTKDAYNVNLVIDKSKAAVMESALPNTLGQLSSEVFGGAPVVVNFCNSSFESYKAIPMAKAAPTESTPVETHKEPTDNSGDSTQH